jgi:hypothetical protein
MATSINRNQPLLNFLLNDNKVPLHFCIFSDFVITIDSKSSHIHGIFIPESEVPNCAADTLGVYISFVVLSHIFKINVATLM